jgi:hypothetical protein
MVIALGVLAGMLCRKLSRPLSARLYYPPIAVAGIAVLVELVLSTCYLFSPTYVDHIEASVASLTHYFQQGLPIYPDLESYTFHGLLYGPLLTELNSLGYLFGHDILASKLVGWAAAWIGAVLIVITPKRSDRNSAWLISTAWVLFVLASFGSTFTANRADSLLLLFATLALCAVVRAPSLFGLALAALLAGCAADLKLHGPLYIAPALYIWVRGNLAHQRAGWTAAILVAAGAAVIGASAPFAPSNISPAGYLTYLGLAARHGLKLEIFAWNCAFLLSAWTPILLVAILTPVRRGSTLPTSPASTTRDRSIFVPLLLAAELIVTTIASKPGAGAHHLLPFLGFHAYLLQRLLAEAARGQRSGTEASGTAASSSGQSLRAPSDSHALQAAVAGLAAVLIGTAWPAAGTLRYFFRFAIALPEQSAEYGELERFASRYPHGMLGVASAESYALTNFRPWLTLTGTRQTDYGAWMDLQLSGVSDAPLARALEHCDIPYLFVPKGGAAFTLANRYGGPLFSDAVRTGFAHRYSLIESSQHFNVFRCLAGS